MNLISINIKKWIGATTLCFSIMGMIRCTSLVEELNVPAPEGSCSMAIDIASPTPFLTRSATDDISPKNAWKAASDGQIMYRLTLFLIRKDLNGEKFLAAYRDIRYDDTQKDIYNPTSNPNGFEAPISGSGSTTFGYPTRAHFSFEYDNIPAGHGASEKLNEGLYDVVAVANWSQITLDGKTHTGLPSLSQSIANIKTKLASSIQGLSVSDPDVGNLLSNRELVSGSDGITSVAPMPLSFVKIGESVKPGMNRISGELIRTKARLRVEVTNLSENHYINLSLLKFGLLGQKASYLFETDPSNPTRDESHEERIGIDVSSSDALTPFVVGDIQDVNQVKHIPGLNQLQANESNSMVVFDAYILESKSGTLPDRKQSPEEIYCYELALNHSATPSTPQCEERTFYRLEKSAQPEAMLKDRDHYIVLCKGNNRIMGHNGNTYSFQDSQIGMNAFAIGTNFLWTKQATTLKTFDANYSIRRDASLGNSVDAGYTWTKNSNNEFTLSYQTGSWIWTTDYYFSVSSANKVATLENPNTGNQNLYFKFYKPLTEIKTIPTDLHHFEMKYINRENDNKVEQLKDIRRNDFVRIRLGVRYNDKNGNFDFELLDWDRKQEDIEFN